MTLTDLYNEIAKHSDTQGTAINVAETKRVLAVAFTVLSKLDTPDVLDLVAKGLTTARRKAEAAGSKK